MTVKAWWYDSFSIYFLYFFKRDKNQKIRFLPTWYSLYLYIKCIAILYVNTSSFQDSVITEKGIYGMCNER